MGGNCSRALHSRVFPTIREPGTGQVQVGERGLGYGTEVNVLTKAIITLWDHFP